MPKRGRRRRRSEPGKDRRYRKRDHLPWLAGIGLTIYIALEPKYGLWVIGLLDAMVLVLWFLFLMPTKCDFEVEGRGCRLDVYGKVQGCGFHGRDKRDAMCAALGLRNPGTAFRLTWLDGGDGGRAVGASRGRRRPSPADDAAHRSQARFNNLSLFVAAVGSAASVLALFVGN